MSRKINIRNINKKLGKSHSAITLSMTLGGEKNAKSVEEWIYGSLNKRGINSIINFKNQKAYNGYQKQKIDLCELFYI